MTSKRKKLSLFLFIDAFGWEIRQRHPAFLRDRICDSKPLETILGYSSACDPSIISGRTPSEHGLWSSYYYDPEGSPFKWTKPLGRLPSLILNRGRVRGLMSPWVAKKCGFTGYFQLYAVPFRHLHLFNYAEQKRIWAPHGLPHGESIFDLMEKRGLSFHVHDSRLPDEMRIQQLKADIRNRRIDFAYCSLGRLDALMHAKGNDTAGIATLLAWYEEHIRNVLAEAEAHYDEVAWYLFTDHGMHNVTETYNLMHDINALGLAWGRDYIAFYDSTMARFWILNEKAREPITRCLEHHEKGRLLPAEELKQLGIYFEDGHYGELIFLMHSGIQIVPSFMGIKPSKGMHGYHPNDPDSFASIASNRSLPESVTNIRHIYSIMLNELGVE